MTGAKKNYFGAAHKVCAVVTGWGSTRTRDPDERPDYSGKYGIYTRVSHYMPWIVRTIRGQ